MRFYFPILLLLATSLTGCRTADRSGTSSRALDGEAPLTPGEAQHTYVVNRSFADGEFLELAVDPTRGITQIVCKHDARSPDGGTVQGYILGDDGVEREVSPKVPADKSGITDLGDLMPRRGGMLVLRFSLPLVRKLPLENVLIRYK